MTYQELQENIHSEQFRLSRGLKTPYAALCAVVNLHNPQAITLPNGECGSNCVICDGYYYPCSTISALKKELR